MGVGDIVAFVKMSDSCCRACRLESAIGASGLAGDGFANALLRSCDAAITWSVEDGMYIVKLEGN